MPQMRVTIIDKVYIDGSCGSKTVASILLARLKRGGHLTRYTKKNRYQCVILYQYGVAGP